MVRLAPVGMLTLVLTFLASLGVPRIVRTDDQVIPQLLCVALVRGLPAVLIMYLAVLLFQQVRAADGSTPYRSWHDAS